MSIPEGSTRVIVRRDSKDSCFSEEMVEDFSATHIDDGCRLSPMALSPLSRKSSACDSAVCMEYDLNRENSLKRNLESPNVKESDRLSMLEERLKVMDIQLRNEMEQRLKLEKKVLHLEEENEKLMGSRAKAAAQLQSFSEKFFAMPEPKYISPVSTPPINSPALLHSPRHSQIELRRVASNSSVLKRLSGQGLPPSMRSRHSNISL